MEVHVYLLLSFCPIHWMLFYGQLIKCGKWFNSDTISKSIWISSYEGLFPPAIQDMFCAVLRIPLQNKRKPLQLDIAYIKIVLLLQNQF